ncbi:bifunctional diguanylate cyclase/phosphodiesterase [Aureimonas jatrophae]|uniref:Diguanylate cyclase (GGDEF) domain-containing protein n=1 Tax=Aureimonas jatrophae TaxID=1166073 RepID=A0A1H0EWB8_9HYPH|nr:EAL domain-containing protein [Aureimonas jatrophae]MBB3950288.1 diguanylate cyclase (GGDEF)-like protein [Aureimonas jatrophae]SDN86569.1 diguanylate cyclase (GGDEF) domain-containing protein [Aureimonas jatrophae]
MIAPLISLAADHSFGFVAAALAICLVGGWLLADIMRTAGGTRARYQRLWLPGLALVAGVTVWTTHFIAMLGYRPDLLLGFDGATTLLSALAAIVAVGVPLALSVRVERPAARAGLGAVAGLGIGAMHQTGMAAIEGCLHETPIATGLAAATLGAACLALARGRPAIGRSRWQTCALFTLAVTGVHFVSLAGTTLTATGDVPASADHGILLSLFTAIGAAVLFLGAFVTILAAKRFDAQERAHSAILSTALENMSNGLLYFDELSRLQLFNQRYAEIFEVDAAIFRLGMSPGELIGAIGDAKGWTPERRRLACSRAEDWMSGTHQTVFDYVMDTGRTMEIELRPVATGGVVMTFDDVTKDREAQRRIAELVFQDPLTRLANRRALQQRMEENFHPKQRFQLLMVDLDRFKAVNDTYGHGAGDALLVQVSQRLVTVVGADGFVARLGGDELAVLLHEEPGRAVEIATRIVEAVARPFVVDGFSVSIGCSIGLCGSADARDATELMQRADIALYESKRRGRGRVSSYRTGMLEAVAEQQMLENDLRTAAERGQFHLVYQPILALGENQVVGREALLRWEHPLQGVIEPARFIPLAEETDQMIEIGRWVLDEACRQAAFWGDGASVCVNVSAVQLRSPVFLAHLTQALNRSGLPASRLEIDITETAVVEDGAQVSGILQAIRRLGVRVAMDDFGTGNSSLAHLRDIPLDRIKIDPAFVSTADTDRHSLAVLRGMTQIARDMRIEILAEGVETPAQLELVRMIGCDMAQGFLIGRPERLDAGVGALTRRAPAA